MLAVPSSCDWRIGLILGSVALAACSSAQAEDDDVALQSDSLTAGQQVKDFLIEDVCLDPAGNATSEDPWTCPTRRRNRKMTDPITYVRRTPDPFAGARGNSYPTQGPSGEFRVAFAHELGKQGWFDKSLGEGTDLQEASGVVSSVNTEDSGGGRNTPFRRYWSQGCINEDGWAYFPTAIFNGRPTGAGTHTISVGATCSGEFKTGWYSWTFDPSMSFSGPTGAPRVTGAIISRQGPGDPNNPMYFEEVQFTGVYGMTRWSAWHRKARTAESDELARKCALPRKTKLGGADFVPAKCNDLVQIDALPPSEWRSSFSWPINEAVSGSHNTLSNADFSAADLAGWSGVSLRVADAHSNFFGQCGSSCFSQSRLEPSDFRGRDKLMFGARIWTNEIADQVTVTASVLRDGTWVVVGSTVAAISGAPSLVMASADAKKGDKIRVSFESANPASQLRVDDAYASFTYPGLF